MNHMDQMDNMAEAVTEHEKINIESLKEVGTFRVEGPDIPNFVGHTTPGLIFVLFGLKCMFNQFYRYFLCLKEEDSGRKHPRKYENSFLFGIARFPGVPVDSIAALVGSTVGFTVELFHYNPVGYALHNLLYVSFGLTCAIDIISKYNPAVPKHVEYYWLIVGLWANGMLLFTHTKHHGPLDSMIHTRLLVIVALAICVVFLEAQMHRNILPAVARSYLCIFLGCWYITIAEILYPVTHEITFTDSHKSLMSLEILFVIEMLSILCLTVVVGTIVHYRVKRMSLSRVSAALDIEYLLVKTKSTFSSKNKGVVYDDGSHKPLINGEEDSESGGCC